MIKIVYVLLITRIERNKTHSRGESMFSERARGGPPITGRLGKDILRSNYQFVIRNLNTKNRHKLISLILRRYQVVLWAVLSNLLSRPSCN